MLFNEAYRLYYDGAGMHEMLGLAKASAERQATKGDRQALAEYFLRKMDYASMPGTIGNVGLYGGAFSYRKVTRQPVEHIHNAMKEEIESKWHKPQLSDKQVHEMLLADAGAGELADLLAKDIRKEFNIRL
ncbi:MAG: hypothetical protein U0L71_03465 [Eggerthellaceae bacterium]|nr:hypothetical protein [Eggerthellaceae bacterium]